MIWSLSRTMELFVFIVEIIWHARFKCSVLKPDHYHSSANHLRKEPKFYEVSWYHKDLNSFCVIKSMEFLCAFLRLHFVEEPAVVMKCWQFFQAIHQQVNLIILFYIVSYAQLFKIMGPKIQPELWINTLWSVKWLMASFREFIVKTVHIIPLSALWCGELVVSLWCP